MAERALNTSYRGSTPQEALETLETLQSMAPDTPRPIIALHLADACRRDLKATAIDLIIISPKISSVASAIAKTFPSLVLTTQDVGAVDTWEGQFRADVAEARVQLEMALLLEANPPTFITTAASTLEAIEQFLDAQPVPPA
ncbi:hypothetical protein [Arthrobacter sp. HLT1-21]